MCKKSVNLKTTNEPFWDSGAQLACHSIPACICLSVCECSRSSSSSSSSSLPMLKVNPSSGLCDVPHLLSMLPHLSISSASSDFSLYSMHPLHPSLSATSLATVPFSPSSIHPSLHAPNLPVNPPSGDSVMCRGAYRRPSLSRQPLVLGVKGKSYHCQSEVLHPFSYSFFFTQWLLLSFSLLCVFS